MKYFQFDPRPIPVAQAANDAIFTQGDVLGIEVTVPSLAARCELGNIDPQHSGGREDLAAIEVALNWPLPPAEAILATVRPDLDSVGAIAVLVLRREGSSLESAADRIRQVAESDRFARGGWPGPQPLPTQTEPWVKDGSARPLAAIAAAVADFRQPLESRVRLMADWLLTGAEPAAYLEWVEKERQELIQALEAGQIHARLSETGRVAVVESTHRAATSIGYRLAPVVVALNPSFRFGDGEAHRKFTVCQFESGWADIKSALVELEGLEPGWGGSPNIGGSPQGISSTLSVEEVVEVVERHLLK